MAGRVWRSVHDLCHTTEYPGLHRCEINNQYLSQVCDYWLVARWVTNLILWTTLMYIGLLSLLIIVGESVFSLFVLAVPLINPIIFFGTFSTCSGNKQFFPWKRLPRTLQFYQGCLFSSQFYRGGFFCSSLFPEEILPSLMENVCLTAMLFYFSFCTADTVSLHRISLDSIWIVIPEAANQAASSVSIVAVLLTTEIQTGIHCITQMTKYKAGWNTYLKML